jgi:hypothetical protein
MDYGWGSDSKRVSLEEGLTLPFMMSLGDSSSSVEISVAEVQPAVPGSPGGDVLVQAHVRRGEFAGAVDAWIDRDAWSDFLAQLVALERARSGEATLVSVSPGELALRFRVIGRAGHMGVDGEMTQYGYSTASELQTTQLRFATIEFDPTLLPPLIEELKLAAPPR